MKGSVLAVSLSPRHKFSKANAFSIRLVEGLGVEGDAHMGSTVKHRSRVAQNPYVPNLRQVHLIHAELFDELKGKGYRVTPGDLGENITTSGIDLLTLPQGALLHVGESVIVELTGLRNPCGQIDKFSKGLMNAVLDRDDQGNLIRKSGVMSIVIAGGDIRPGDSIVVELPAGAHRPLAPV
jgi:hypothetical protein